MIWFSGSTAAAEIDRQIMTSDCVALLTAPGVAAIAVVRLTGPGVNRFLRKHFSKPVPAGVCVYGNLVDGDRMIDDAVAVCHENQLDLNLHGGTWVVQSVLQLAQTLGFKISDRNAVEGVCDQWQQVLLALPRAHTEQAVRMLLSQPAAWESAVDLEKVMADRSGYWMLNLPRVAIVGPANVGKSTIANQLFGQARSITADLPGTTRDWVGEIANIDGLAVMLLDMPGQRHTDDPIEQAAITASGKQIDSADLIVLVLDQSVELDAHLLRQYPKAICVANKTDVKHRWHAAQINAVETIAILGQGLDALRAEIRRRFDCEPMDLGRARWWTTQQRDYLNKNGNLTNTS